MFKGITDKHEDNLRYLLIHYCEADLVLQIICDDDISVGFNCCR